MIPILEIRMRIIHNLMKIMILMITLYQKTPKKVARITIQILKKIIVVRNKIRWRNKIIEVKKLVMKKMKQVKII
jgi:hypothetical protein